MNNYVTTIVLLVFLSGCSSSKQTLNSQNEVNIAYKDNTSIDPQRNTTPRPDLSIEKISSTIAEKELNTDLYYFPINMEIEVFGIINPQSKSAVSKITNKINETFLAYGYSVQNIRSFIVDTEKPPSVLRIVLKISHSNPNGLLAKYENFIVYSQNSIHSQHTIDRIIVKKINLFTGVPTLQAKNSFDCIKH